MQEQLDHTAIAAGVVGYIDRISGQRATGWAWNRFRPDQRLSVEFKFAGKTVATTVADRPRADLARGAIGDGSHAFEAALGESIPIGAEGKLQAFARINETTLVPLVNRLAEEPITVAADAPTPELRRWLEDLTLVQRGFETALRNATREIRETLREGVNLPPAGALPEPDAVPLMLEIRATQENIERQVAVLEVFQSRIDGRLAELERLAAERQASNGSRAGFQYAVLIAAGLSALSLIVGICSLIF